MKKLSSRFQPKEAQKIAKGLVCMLTFVALALVASPAFADPLLFI